MDHTIARRLNGLLRRFRLFRMLWSLTIVWIVVAIVGYLLLSYGKQLNGLPSQYVQGWIAAIAIGTVGCWWYARIKHRDVRSIAELIESRFPNLEQRLTTAVELRPLEANGRFTYLQRSVISEALVHDVRNEWDSLVSMRRILIAALAGLPSLIAICAVGFALWRLPKTTFEPSVSSNSNEALSSKVLPPEVVPGSTEVQKGESIIVTARFPGQLPSKVWLVRQSLGDAEASGISEPVDRQLMKQSLSDPLFAAYLNDIQKPIEYRIEYDIEKTQNYSVKVFECPEVVRADAKLSYPLYTKLDPKEIADTRRVAAPIGTTLTWLVLLSKPIDSGKLIPKSAGEPIELVVDKENPLLARCSLVVTENAQWNVQLVDSDNRQNKIDYSLRVTALANKEPTLKLTAGGDAVVSALQEFEIVAKVKDDYALTSVGMGYQLADGELIEQELEVLTSDNAKKSKESTVSATIDFEALKAQPDQLLSYYLWAEDLDEDGEPRRIVTDIFFVEVRPFDEIFRQSDQNAEQQEQQQQQQQNQNGQQQGGQGEELLELQKQIISASWNINRLATSKGLPARSKADLETVAQSQTQALEMLAEQAAQAEEDQEAEVAVAQASMHRAVEQLGKATESLKKSDLSQAINYEQQAYQSLLRLQPKENEVGQRQRSQRSQQQSRRQQQRQQQLNQMELDQEENRYQDERKAQEEQDNSQQSETRQIASRLRELAMRQQDLNQQLRDVEAALQAAETKEQREELEQRLERLRQQQQQILEDTDELQDKLQESQNPNMQETQEQLQQTRENLQQANQSLRENNTGQALASGSRAQEQLEEMREEVRQQAANQFGETMQQMRGQSGELQQRQEELIKQLQENKSESSTGLRDEQQKDSEQTKELVQQQREQLKKLTDRMQETIEQAEESEPLLAQKLFDGYRRTQQEGLDNQLENTGNLLEGRLERQAQNQAGETLDDLKSLNNDIRQAAEAVLGSDINSMRMALDQLDVARKQIENEIARETGRQPGEANGESSERDERNQRQPGQQEPGGGTQPAENQQGQGQRGQNQPGQNQEGQEPSQQAGQAAQQAEQQPGQQQGQQQGQQPGQQQGQQSGEQTGQSNQEQSQQQGQQQAGQGQQSQPGQQQGGQRPGQQGGRQGQRQSGNQQPGLRNGGFDADSPDDETRPGLLGGNGLNTRDLQASPITGEDFRQWSDRLRDVEELISDPELRWQATRIRQAARNLRTDLQRNSKAPQWSDVEDLVATPLRELQRKVSQELLRRAAEQTEIVPVDRDPVPNQYRDMVREYYERLGKGR